MHRTGPWEDVATYLFHPSQYVSVMAYGDTLDSHVYFLGRLDHARLKFLFPCADIGVFPSIVPEACPLVLMESLANGVYNTLQKVDQ